MLLDEVATYLAAQLSLTVGTTLFKGNRPDTPDACVTVYEYGGIEPEHTMGTDHIIRRPRIQVACRGPVGDYATPRTQAEAAYTAMHFDTSTLTGVTYFRSEAIDEPFVLERDANDRWVIVCNYQIWKS